MSLYYFCYWLHLHHVIMGKEETIGYPNCCKWSCFHGHHPWFWTICVVIVSRRWCWETCGDLPLYPIQWVHILQLDRNVGVSALVEICTHCFFVCIWYSCFCRRRWSFGHCAWKSLASHAIQDKKNLSIPKHVWKHVRPWRTMIYWRLRTGPTV